MYGIKVLPLQSKLYNMNLKLCAEDIISVANSIGVVLTGDMIGDVLRQYPYEQKMDPTATWDLVVENIIHNLTD